MKRHSGPAFGLRTRVLQTSSSILVFLWIEKCMIWIWTFDFSDGMCELWKKTPFSFSVVVFSYQKTVMHCVVDVMSLGTKLIQSNSHKLWRIISTHSFNLKTSVQKNRDSEQRVRQEMGDLYALDFDGVICDSCGESSLSAVKVVFVFIFFQSSKLFYFKNV